MTKIVHINATGARGGAAIACSRLNDALNRAGISSSMLVADNPSLINRIKKSIFYRINHPKELLLDTEANFSLMRFGLPIYKSREVMDADIIFIHWVCANTLSIEGVEKTLQLGKPTFWFMHDMFPFTGGCHYSLSCDRYKGDCNDCPQIRNKSYKEEARKQLLRKINHWTDYRNLEFIAPSNWEAKCASESSLCRGHKVHVAANIIDTTTYKPATNSFKEKFGLDVNKRTILFGASRINSPYKGAHYAKDCLKMLDPERFEGLVIGNADSSFVKDLPIKVIQTGFLSDDATIAMAYNACDTFIMTSIAESFGQVVAEAMACGKPCIGFPTGGVLDLIKHGQTGFLTKKYEASELIDGIRWIFADGERYNELSRRCRNQILEQNSFLRVKDIHKEIKPYLND